MVSGLTQCGSPRDACIDCPASDVVDEKSCPKDCNHVIETNVPKGCTVKKCRAKTCTKCLVYDFTTKDKCGCQACITKSDIVFQERSATDNEEFNRNWADFKNGFTSANGFWLGLERVHQMTKSGQWQLVVRVKYSSDESWAYSVMDGFSIGSEAEGYVLRFGEVIDHHGVKDIKLDQISYPANSKFSTVD